MSKIEGVSSRIADICSGVVGLAFGDVSGITKTLAGVAGVALLGKRLQQAASTPSIRASCLSAIKKLSEHGAFSSQALERVALVLADSHAATVVRPADVAKRIHEADPARALAHEIASRLVEKNDAEVLRILQVVLEAGIRACMEDAEFRASLTPEILKQTARDLSILHETVERLDRKSEVISEKLSALLKGASVNDRPDLERLASTFGLDATGMTQKELIETLEHKAEDHALLVRDFATLDERMSEIAKQKRQANEALETLDLEGAQELLAKIDFAESDIVCETRTLRARTALMLGDIDNALTLHRQVRDLAASYEENSYSLATFMVFKKLAEWATRNNSHPAMRGACDLGFEYLDASQDQTDFDTRDLRFKTIQEMASLCATVIAEQRVGQGDEVLTRRSEAIAFAGAIFARLQHSLQYDLEEIDTDLACQLVAAKSNLDLALVRAGLIVREEELLATITDDLRYVLNTGNELANSEIIVSAASNLALALMEQARRQTDENHQLELLQEASRLIEEIVLNPEHGATDQNISQALNMMAVTQVSMAKAAKGPVRDAMLSSAIMNYEALLAKPGAQDDPILVSHVLMNVATAAVLRAETASGSTRDRLKAAAATKIEAAQLYIGDDTETRKQEDLSKLRSRLDNFTAD